MFVLFYVQTVRLPASGWVKFPPEAVAERERVGQVGMEGRQGWVSLPRMSLHGLSREEV